MSDAPRERRIAANGLRFRALEWPGAPPPALLVHATSFCAEAWTPVWQAARMHGAGSLRAVAVDQRGHGGSDAPGEASAYAWTELGADVAALAEAVAAEDSRAGPRRVVAIGHSSGATACLAAAGRAPERFAALVVVEPVLFERPAGPGDSFLGSGALAASARRRRRAFPSLAEARARLGMRFPYRAFDLAAFDAVLAGGLARADDGSVLLRCPGEREAWCYEGAAALDLWPLAARIEAPLLLVQGEHGAVPVALRDRLLAGRAGARAVTVESATHFVALERPAEVGRAIGAFLAEAPG